MNIREMYEEQEYKFLSKYASKSRDCRGRDKPSKKNCDIRTIYQQDRDRIIHSKSFRRLKHKTQVFLSAYIGDHFRTRLTHTLEVSQISRTIARGLRLNEDLTEAIALGHDLGHTPFGHSGEKVLNDLSENGFKHNKQSLRIVEVLERDGNGLNLTKEVRDGIVNHTGKGVPFTLEGRIVKIADRIAYINHDIDDALRAGVLKIEEIPKEYLDVLGDSHSSRINTLVKDMINASMDKNDILQTPKIRKAMLGLRSFLFENFYLKEDITSRFVKSERIIRFLYEFYWNNPDKIESRYKSEDTEQSIIDYISGMSDNYAIKKLEEYFLP